MAEFRFYPPDVAAQAPQDQVFQALDAAQGNRKETLRILVEEARRLAESINTQQANVSCHLEDVRSGTSDIFGWTMWIRQQFVNERYGFSAEDDYRPTTVILELQELEINDGNPIMKIYNWKHENGEMDFGSFPHTVSLTPKQTMLYLLGIAATGDAYPVLVER